MPANQDKTPYHGFEQGPIRPPSEAQSLLIRVMRNCPWNRCAFCPVYKGADFSLRPLEHVLADIDAVHSQLRRITSLKGQHSDRAAVQALLAETPANQHDALCAAAHWHAAGMRSVFLQDANALIVKPEPLREILLHLRNRFPDIKRITCYARAHTAAARKAEDLVALARAGLNRVHIGLESGSDAVLALMRKGATKAQQIAAGKKIRQAGIELSEYYMPGLGGRALSREHALESADALNEINPHFIRIRTLAIPGNTPLHDLWTSGQFEKCTDREMAEELAVFIERLHGVDSVIKSDHILNLFDDLQGNLPGDKPRMLDILYRFLALDPERQMMYQLGRRLGYFQRLEDLEKPRQFAAVDEYRRQWGVTPGNIDTFIDEAMRRFI